MNGQNNFEKQVEQIEKFYEFLKVRKNVHDVMRYLCGSGKLVTGHFLDYWVKREGNVFSIGNDDIEKRKVFSSTNLNIFRRRLIWLKIKYPVKQLLKRFLKNF